MLSVGLTLQVTVTTGTSEALQISHSIVIASVTFPPIIIATFTRKIHSLPILLSF